MSNQLIVSIIFVAVALCVLGAVLYKAYTPQAKRIIKYAVGQAELKFEEGLNDIKFDAVIGFAYPKLPIWIRAWVSVSTLTLWINSAVALLRVQMSSHDITTLTPITNVAGPVVVSEIKTGVINDESIKLEVSPAAQLKSEEVVAEEPKIVSTSVNTAKEDLPINTPIK